MPLGGVEYQQILDEVFPSVGHVLEVGKVQGVVAGEGLERMMRKILARVEKDKIRWDRIREDKKTQ